MRVYCQAERPESAFVHDHHPAFTMQRRKPLDTQEQGTSPTPPAKALQEYIDTDGHFSLVRFVQNLSVCASCVPRTCI